MRGTGGAVGDFASGAWAAGAAPADDEQTDEERAAAALAKAAADAEVLRLEKEREDELVEHALDVDWTEPPPSPPTSEQHHHHVPLQHFSFEAFTELLLQLALIWCGPWRLPTEPPSAEVTKGFEEAAHAATHAAARKPGDRHLAHHAHVATEALAAHRASYPPSDELVAVAVAPYAAYLTEVLGRMVSAAYQRSIVEQFDMRVFLQFDHRHVGVITLPDLQRARFKFKKERPGAGAPAPAAGAEHAEGAAAEEEEIEEAAVDDHTLVAMLEYAQTKEGGGHGGGIGIWEFHEVTANKADPVDAFAEWTRQTRAWQAHALEKKMEDMRAAEAAAEQGSAHSSRRGSVHAAHSRRGSRRQSGQAKAAAAAR